MRYPLKLRVNGRQYEGVVPAKTTLAEFLRQDMSLTGTKQGCGEGECGACTVLVDGTPVNSCCMLAIEADGCEITTIEGVSSGLELHPIQKAFVEVGAIQCGYCTPGMVLTTKALLDKKSSPSAHEIREALAGNLCRCTGYQKIVDAIGVAAEEMNSKKGGGR
ncbi:MAG: (2Fe-2S)-binding protein [Deltaproteobacteria bacterium]|nr:(2Fe-2S)-binding protein [Deltaproteobacteria bacterium]